MKKTKAFLEPHRLLLVSHGAELGHMSTEGPGRLEKREGILGGGEHIPESNWGSVSQEEGLIINTE